MPIVNKETHQLNGQQRRQVQPPRSVYPHVDINNKLFITNKPIQMVGETNEQESIKFLGIY